MKHYFSSLSLVALLSGGLNAIDFKVSGGLEFFSKVGFNQQKIDAANNIYPTDTWGAAVGSLQVDIDFLTQEQKDLGQTLTGSIGVMAGGLLFDLTKDASSNPLYNSIFFGSNGKGNSVVGQEYITANFVPYNLFLDYTTTKNNHFLEIKVGRYKSKAQFYSGFTQGFELEYKYKGFSAWWFSSYGRAFAYSQWMYDFYAPKKHGNTNYGVHAFKPSYTFDSGFYISPFVYFSPDFYVAPMLEVSFTSNPKFEGKGFNSKTKVIIMAPFHTQNAQTDWRYQNLAGKNGQTLSIDQEFNVNNWKFGLGWYQNFGNANAHIGTYGNAALGAHWDFWTNSVYDFGALSNATTRDAMTGYAFLGASHGKFSWDILGRMTWSPRADEQAIPLNLNFAINKNVSIWFKLEWQRVTTHAGYFITDGTGAAISDTTPNLTKKSVSSDRSHAMINLAYKF